MRYFLTMGLGGLLAIGLAACGGEDDGTIVVRDPLTPGAPVSIVFDIEDFTAIEVGGPFQLSILQGSEFSVELRVNSTVVDALDVELQGNALQIGFRNGTNVRANTLEAVVVMPELVRVSFSGATTGMFSGFSGSNLEIDLNGASFLEGLNVNYDFVTVQAAGACQLLMEDVTPLPAAHAQLIGASSATLRLMNNGTLTGALLGASAIFYFGENVNAQVSTDITSSVSRLDGTP